MDIMSLVLDADRRYSEICWLSAHNAYSSKAYRWLYNQQTLSFDDMYDFGVRCFGIDIHWHAYGSSCTGSGEREVAMMHGPNTFLNVVAQRQGPPPRFETFLETVAAWMEDRNKSRDIITINLESYIGDKDTLDELWEKYDLLDKLYIHNRSNRRSRWPTLGEMRESGKRLVVFSNNSNDGVNSNRTLMSANHWNYDINEDGSNILYDRGALVHFDHIQPVSVKIGSRYAKFNSLEHMSSRAANFRRALEEHKEISPKYSIPNFVSVDHVSEGNAKNLVEIFNNEFSYSIE